MRLSTLSLICVWSLLSLSTTLLKAQKGVQAKKYAKGLIMPSNAEEMLDLESQQYFLSKKFLLGSKSAVPDSYNAVEEGLVTSVKNQGQCGSCAAFATVAAVETCFRKLTGVNASDDYSEQQFVDCGYKKYEAKGCEGAYLHSYLQYGADQSLVPAHEVQYPYPTDFENHKYNCPAEGLPSYNLGAKMGKVRSTFNGDEELLKREVFENGAVMVAISTTGRKFRSFNNYEGGIYEDCRLGGKIDHGVVVVGYGEEDGVPYWLIKNSWGTDWGENGYMRMRRGVGMCAIGTVMAVAACEAVEGPTDEPPAPPTRPTTPRTTTPRSTTSRTTTPRSTTSRTTTPRSTTSRPTTPRSTTPRPTTPRSTETTVVDVKCPDSFLKFKNHCYLVQRSKMSWQEAEANCIELGGHLASVHSKEEDDFIFSLIKGKGQWVWLGAEMTGTKVTDFTWADETSVDFTNWYTGQKYAKVGNAIQKSPNHGMWGDYDGEEFSICKI